MASIPENHPALYVSLIDAALAPLLSSNFTNSSTQCSNTFITSEQDIHATALTTYTTARRLGLGRPLRVMVETAEKGPVALHSYLNPPIQRRLRLQNSTATENNEHDQAAVAEILASTRDGLRDVGGDMTDGEADDHHQVANGTHSDFPETAEHTAESEEICEVEDTQEEDGSGESDDEEVSKLLIATVIAPDYNHAKDARRALGRLERLGTEFQREIVRAAQETSRDEEENEAPE